MRTLILYLVIMIIWIIISVVKNSMKKNAQNSKNTQNDNSRKVRNDYAPNDEDQIFKNLRRDIESRNRDEEKTYKDYSDDTMTSIYNEDYEEHRIHNNYKETERNISENSTLSNAEEEILTLQKKYQEQLSKLNTTSSINEVTQVYNVEPIRMDPSFNMETSQIYSFNNSYSGSRYDNKIIDINIKNVIIYNAILEPKRIHYSLVNTKTENIKNNPTPPKTLKKSDKLTK